MIFFIGKRACRRVLLGVIGLLGSGLAPLQGADQLSIGSYRSVQVNVDESGHNIIGDAANEPTIGVNPVNPDNMVIAWRQFDSATDTFRQGGWAYSFDAGMHWRFPGSLTPGEGRSNPVIDVDSQGNFYYQSLRFNADYSYVQDIQVIKSVDGGVSWLEPVHAHGELGDKGQIAVDRSGGPSDGHVYVNWRDGTDEKCFTRSVDGGRSFEAPVEIPGNPSFGTLAVGPQGELYAVGRSEPGYHDEASSFKFLHDHIFAKSLDAGDSQATPTFSTRDLDLGGPAVLFLTQKNPNQYGPIGDVQIAVDHSGGVLHGRIYVLASVDPEGDDPMDIHFVHSDDGGETWSAPLRVNDDSLHQDSWQWFGMMDVAANSRIDAVWYDTRSSGSYAVSQLYYSYSWDGGETWSPNTPVSQPFDTTIAYPHGSRKIGDYATLVSTNDGASVAYTATFNNEQDVYYLQVFPDCDGNGQSDVLDLEQHVAEDVDLNHIPDSCESVSIAGDLDGDSDVDEYDLQTLLKANNRLAVDSNDPMDLDGNGVINALDARRLVLMCTRPQCKGATD